MVRPRPLVGAPHPALLPLAPQMPPALRLSAEQFSLEPSTSLCNDPSPRVRSRTEVLRVHVDGSVCASDDIRGYFITNTHTSHQGLLLRHIKWWDVRTSEA